MSQSTTTRTLSPVALKAEQSRRLKNKQRVKAARDAGATPDEIKQAKKRGRGGWVVNSLADAEIKALLDGEVVTKTYKSGRVEVIGTK